MTNSKDIEKLERQGCQSDDWSRVSISEKTDLGKIRNVVFRGDVRVGSHAEIINVPGGLANVRIGDNVHIVNVARIECTPGATFGIGTDINVLDETGTRPVRIYPGISAQVATLASRLPDFAGKLTTLIDEHIRQLPDKPEIGDNTEILDSGTLINVRIGQGVKVEGALRLENGSVINNSPDGQSLAHVGYGVDAENFIIEDGIVDGGCQLRSAYVGQGVLLDKHFTAHDSLFFANCTMENGEACAVLAGPYTVSMHKSSLLIGVQTSFMNAGSGTNMSNHMYKLGPVHWGILERGVKMGSNSYLMHGSRIGAYSLVMGDHKLHPDSAEFPFSYLFGDPKGNTTIVPAAMLGSYGLKRDGEKWPARDRRIVSGLPLHDRITFSIFNPYTRQRIRRALTIIGQLLDESSRMEDSSVLTYRNMKVSRKHLLRAQQLYGLVIGGDTDEGDADRDNWIDLGGQVIPCRALKELTQSQSIAEIENILDKVSAEYDSKYSDKEFDNLSELLDQDKQSAEDSLTDYALE